jgi:hypothetical protein
MLVDGQSVTTTDVVPKLVDGGRDEEDRKEER